MDTPFMEIFLVLAVGPSQTGLCKFGCGFGARISRRWSDLIVSTLQTL